MSQAKAGALLMVGLLLGGCGPGAGTTVVPGNENGSSSTGQTTRSAAVAGNAIGGEGLEVTFMDVGQADAILLQRGEFDVLVDAGLSVSGPMKRGLETVSGPLEILALTHPHHDHYGGGEKVMSMLEVSRVVTNGESRGAPRDPKPLVTWTDFEDAVREEGRSPEALSEGQALVSQGGLEVTVLWSGGHFPDTPKGKDINNDSLVLMVSYAGRRLLLTGDIETDGEKAILKEHCPSGPQDCPALRADVLKVPHHGSGHFSEDFFRAVSPTVAVISAAHNKPKGRHCLPRAETVRVLRKVGAAVLSTSEEPERNLALLIEPDGTMTWTPSQTEVFAWEVEGKVCTGSLL